MKKWQETQGLYTHSMRLTQKSLWEAQLSIWLDVGAAREDLEGSDPLGIGEAKEDLVRQANPGIAA